MSGSEIWLVRHGETEWSRSGRHTGSTDVPLTGDGERQAERLGAALGVHRFARVLCSPLWRARQTCAAAGLLDRAEIREELAEWDYGEYEGRTTAEIDAERPGWLLWTDGAPGGETAVQVGARLDPLIAELRHLAGDAVLFAHGHVLRVLAARWIEQDPALGRRLALGTGTFCRLAREHAYPVIRAWNVPA